MRTLLSRRELLAGAILAAGGGCLCALGAQPKATCCFTPDLEPESYILAGNTLKIDLTKAATLKRPHSAAYVVAREGELQLIIVRSGRKSYHVLSRLCTHGRQVLSYVRERRRLMCNSFNHSQFYLDGTIAKGPAESAIQAYPCRLKGGVLEVTV
jgi:nitrite reductase/ring-hydroxylating ferredoxin subunit